MDKLPTRIRQNIRDHITSDSSPLSLKFKSLSTTLGYPVAFDPEWPILWGMFQQHHPDPSTFVPTIAVIVVAWCDSFLSWLDKTDNEESVDKLLDDLSKVGTLRLVLNTSAKIGGAQTRFDLDKHNFELILPSSKRLTSSALESGFASNLLELFQEPTSNSRSTAAVMSDEPDWAEVSMHAPVVAQLSDALHRDSSYRETAEYIPDIATIERPEELLKKPPYWLFVRQEGRNRVVVEASHAASLKTLEAYLSKWCRGDGGRVDRPAVVEIRLRESPFGLGVLYDTLALETLRGRELNATLILAFVENVLGYTLEPGRGSVGSVWEFKRTRAFK